MAGVGKGRSKAWRRAVLICIALLLVAGNLWWFMREAPRPVPDFELSRTDAHLEATPGELAGLPRYDVDQAGWRTVAGAPRDISAYRREPLSEGRPTPGPSAVLVALAADFAPSDMRAMLLSLVEAGICGVAVAQEGQLPLTKNPQEMPGVLSFDVSRIVAVRGDGGERIACQSDQSVAAASSASR